MRGGGCHKDEGAPLVVVVGTWGWVGAMRGWVAP